MRTIAKLIPNALQAAGAAGITIGAALVSRPAGWAVGGGFILAAGIVQAR